jgi:hypothetical protein
LWIVEVLWKSLSATCGDWSRRLAKMGLKPAIRTTGTTAAQKAALTDDIRAMVDATDADLIGFRGRALILLGFAGAFRRSELAALRAARYLRR